MTQRCYPVFPVVIVEDEIAVSETEALALEMTGISNVIVCNTVGKALDIFSGTPRALAVLDINMPNMSGLELLAKIRQEYPGIHAIMLTGLNDVRTAVNCMRGGAIDYIVKPVDMSRLETSIRNAIAYIEKETEADLLGTAVLKNELRYPEAFASILTADPAMFGIFQYLDALASTDLPILVTGETGTGKELVAEALHAASCRKGEFVRVNSAGIDDTLFSDALFGHEKGAFTGAEKQRTGFVAHAADGTLFLDEIGDLRPESQVKLLRLLQEGVYHPLGSEKERRSTARIVAATNVSLNDLQNNPAFRKDLFFRLKSHHVRLSPLRMRKNDIPMLADFFLDRAAKEQGKKRPAVPPELYTMLGTYHFPGNVRELRGMIYDAVGRHSGGLLSCESIRRAVGLAGDSDDRQREIPVGELMFPARLPTLEQAKTALFDEALRRSGGNKSIAAAILGITRQSLRNRSTTP